MLTTLSIQNFGLIDSMDIEFGKGLNVFTGETGAGKSIIIESLRFALGGRIKSSQVRDPEKSCLVEAVFEILDRLLFENSDLKEFLKDDPTLIISRQHLPDGRSKIKINGFSVTVAQLKAVGDHLLDLHGAHDHQMLFIEDQHIRILDQLVDFGPEKDSYEKQFTAFSRLKSDLDQLQSMAASRERDLDLLAHQIRELEQVPLDQEAYTELCSEWTRVNNAEKLHEQASGLLEIFENDESGLTEQVRRAFGPVRELVQTDASVSRFDEQLNEIQDRVGQLAAGIRDYLETLSFQPQEAAALGRRFDIYEDIRRKYGPQLEEAREFYRDAKKRYEVLRDFEHNDRDLREKVEEAGKKVKEQAGKLTKKRRDAAGKLKSTIEQELKQLGIPHVEFETNITVRDCAQSGQDEVRFFISPNAGEALKPLSEIVSSGEAARVMLALKKALINVDPIPVLVFDEIDAQIGGRLGTVTGTKLKELSMTRQVILITHLPQIASFADRHLKVFKEVSGGRTSTGVKLLSAKERVEELAHMMDGEKQTRLSLSHAQDMLAGARTNTSRS